MIVMEYDPIIIAYEFEVRPYSGVEGWTEMAGTCTIEEGDPSHVWADLLAELKDEARSRAEACEAQVRLRAWFDDEDGIGEVVFTQENTVAEQFDIEYERQYRPAAEPYGGRLHSEGWKSAGGDVVTIEEGDPNGVWADVVEEQRALAKEMAHAWDVEVRLMAWFGEDAVQGREVFVQY